MTPPPPKPTADDLRNAAGKTLEDVIAPHLRVLFCGINPGLYTAAIGCHFGRPGNRFWPALHLSGFTDRLLKPWEQNGLLERGLGITNLVARATVSAAELTRQELKEGGQVLSMNVRQHEPQWLAFVGIEAYRYAFSRPKASFGEQAEKIENARVWLLPNTSGLNAHFKIDVLAELFRELREAAFL
jgi:TDG/mug DNA glycosylase family protein